MIKAVDISYSYSFGPVFDRASFSVGNTMKVGLTGPNGAGKSTLFKLLIHEDTPTSGTLSIEGSIAHVPQEVKRDVLLDQSENIRSYIDPDHKKHDHELHRMIQGLEMDLSLENTPQLFSGGQKTKLAILRAMIAEPDILLLDEPTNFLDKQGTLWMMNFLRHYEKTLVIISHDLPLLDSAINKVLSVNSFTKKIEEYKGNYTTYLRLKAEQDALLTRNIVNEQKHIKRMEKGLERMARYSSEKGVRRRTNLKRRIERIKDSLPELPKELKGMKMTLEHPRPTGEIPISAQHITKTFGEDVVLSDVSFSLRKNERVAILGPNGSGKTTCIKILMGLLSPDSGTVITDERVTIGYYSQEFDTFDFEKTLLQTVEEQCELSEGRIRQYLSSFLFPGDRVKQQVGTLSGGEKTRLAIALLMIKNPNLLILDEPTTYLDVLSQRIILNVLKQYTGAMIFVSHTEQFVTELTPNRVLLMPEATITYWMPEFTEKVGEI